MRTTAFILFLLLLASAAFAEESVCGNGVVEVAEECDDGNIVPNDGCGASCIWETTTEYGSWSDTQNGEFTVEECWGSKCAFVQAHQNYDGTPGFLYIAGTRKLSVFGEKGKLLFRIGPQFGEDGSMGAAVFLNPSYKWRRLKFTASNRFAIGWNESFAGRSIWELSLPSELAGFRMEIGIGSGVEDFFVGPEFTVRRSVTIYPHTDLADGARFGLLLSATF